MAIDPRIALGVNPPVIAPLQLRSPIEQFGKMLSLRNLMTQGQLGQLNVQQTQLENEALREKQRRVTGITNLFSRGKAPTEDEIYAVGGPDAAAVIKSLHDTDKARLDATEARVKAVNRTAMGIQALPEDKRDLAYRLERARILAENPAFGSQLPDQYPGHDWLTQRINEGLSAEGYFSKVRADAKEAVEKPGLVADAAGKQLRQDASVLAAAAARGPEALATAVAALPTERQAPFLGAATPLDVMKRAQTPEQLVSGEQAEYGKTKPYPAPVQEQKIAEAAARANVLQTPEKMAQELDIKRRELELQTQSNINKAMSGEASKVYSIASNIQPGLVQLREAFQRDYNGTLRGIVLGTSPELAKLASNVSDQVGRLRSGGAVNPSEEKRFKDQIASVSDLAVGNPTATLAALDRYIAEAKAVADNLKPSGGGAPAPGPSGRKIKVWNEKTNRFEER